MGDDLDDLSSFGQVVLCLDHPVAHPLVPCYLWGLEGDFFFVEGELVHDDEVEADAQTQDIAFFVVQVALVEVHVGEGLVAFPGDHQIGVLCLGVVLLFGVDPVTRDCIGLLKASNSDL